MKGIRSKIITDEETVRMHTNFAEFKNVEVGMSFSDIATYSNIITSDRVTTRRGR